MDYLEALKQTPTVDAAELAEMRAQVLRFLAPGILVMVESIGIQEVPAHVCPFEERVSFLEEVAGRFLQSLDPPLSESETLTLATYFYHYIDSVLTWENTWRSNPEYDQKPFKLTFLQFVQDWGRTCLGEEAVILDIGSGKRAVSEYLRTGSNKIINVDCAAPSHERTRFNVLRIRLDVNVVSESTRADVQEALDECCAFIAPRENVDVIILSEILNYIDYEEVLPFLDQYLRNSGHVIIYNNPSLFLKPSALSKNGPVDARDACDFLQERGYALIQGLINHDDEREKFAVLQKL